MMQKIVTKRSKKKGLPPGTLLHIGEKKTDIAKISIIDYDEKHFQEKNVKKIEDCFPFRKTSTVTWIDIDGVHDVEIIEKIGKKFGFHPLLLEDIVTTEQRPKIEDFKDHLYVVLKMLSYDEKENKIKSEQISLILGENFVISFQESEGDVFDPVRDMIKNKKGNIRSMGSDYLLYSLMDVIVDNYFLILERSGEVIEDLEDAIINNPTPKNLKKLHNLKSDMISLRKSVWPLREVVSGFERSSSSLVKESTRLYLRDIYDHTIQIIDTVETFRDMLSGMMDIYLSSVSNKLNEVMKVLTIISTIFIPLTFIAGVYGMNFKHMPELELPWTYPAIWVIMISIGVVMMFYFKKKRWI